MLSDVHILIAQFAFFAGMPTEVYVYGINILYVLPTFVVMGLFVHHVIIPVFYELQIVSTYEVHKHRRAAAGQSSAVV